MTRPALILVAALALGALQALVASGGKDSAAVPRLASRHLARAFARAALCEAACQRRNVSRQPGVALTREALRLCQTSDQLPLHLRRAPPAGAGSASSSPSTRRAMVVASVPESSTRNRSPTWAGRWSLIE